MNATDRFKTLLRFSPHDHLQHDRVWLRVYRDIQCGPTGQPKFRHTPYPSQWDSSPSVWARTQGCYRYRRNPRKMILRFLRLRRAIDRDKQGPNIRFFRLCDARKVAYGWDYPLQLIRAHFNAAVPLTPRQQRIAYLKQRL